MSSHPPDPRNRLERLVFELRSNRARETELFGTLDDNTLARYLAGECDDMQLRAVESEAQQHPDLQRLLDIVNDVFLD